MEGNPTNNSAQEQQIGDRQNRNGQSHFQNMISNNGYYQHQRSQQSPSAQGQSAMGQQPQRTTRIFLPHQTTIKNQHQRQSSNGGQGKGVTFQKNRRPGDLQNVANREGSHEPFGQSAGQMGHYGADGGHTNEQNDNMNMMGHQQNLQGGYQNNLDNQANVSQDEADISVSVSIPSRHQRSSKQRQEDYAFSPRDGHANVKYRVIQPNFKKRTPSGVPAAQSINNQQIHPSNRGATQQHVKTQEQFLSMSPPILRHGATDDSNAEDFAVENEEGEAEMSAVNHNAKQSQPDGHGAVKEGTIYPRMFAGKFKGKPSQKNMNQMNANRGAGRRETDNHIRGSSPFEEGTEHFERARGDYEEDAHDEPTCSQVFYLDDQEEKNADIQLPYSQTSSPNVNQEQWYGKGQSIPKRPSKLSTSKNAEKRLTQARKVHGAQTNSIAKPSQAAHREAGKFSLNLQGVQDKSTKLRKILSMRDPVSMSPGRQRDMEDDDQNSENVYDNGLSSGDIDGADRMYNRQEAERHRVESVRQERGVHSPAEKFSSKRSNNPIESRGKYTVKSSWKNQSKSKSNTIKFQSVSKNVKAQNDLDHQAGVKNSQHLEGRQKSGNRAVIKFDNQTSGSKSARGPQATIRGLSHSRIPVSFQNPVMNPQQQQVGWQPTNVSASRMTFNQTQKLTLKGSSSTNLNTKQPQQKQWQKQLIDENSDNAEYNFIDQIEKDGENEGETSPSKLECQGLMEMPKTNHLMSQRNRISNISGKGQPNYPQHTNVKESVENMTPSTLMPQQMKISPSKRKNNNQVVMMMQHSTNTGSGSASGPSPSTGMTDDRMRRKGRGQQEQGNPKQTSDKYNIYNNPIATLQASQVYNTPDQLDQLEQDEDLGQEFSSPYSQYPNHQQKPRKSSVRLSNPDEERQEIKNHNMHKMIPSASQDLQSKMQHYNRLPSKSVQLNVGRRLNFRVKSLINERGKVYKMPCSIFEQLQEQFNEQGTPEDFEVNQKSPKMGGLDNELREERPIAQFHMSDKRIERLYDEIYSDESGAFFGFFQSADKKKKDVRRLESYYETTTGRQRDNRISPPIMSETDYSSNTNFNTFRDAAYHKEEYQRKKTLKKKLTAKDLKTENDPLAQLWQELQDQDEELIFSESTQIQISEANYNTQRMVTTSMQNLYASGIDSCRPDRATQQQDGSMKGRDQLAPSPSASKPQVIQYDYHADVHSQAHDFAVNVSCYEQMVHYFVCYQKSLIIKEFMKAKSRHSAYMDDQYKFQLRNSIIPAIQGHIQILMDVPPQYKDKLMATALSARTIQSKYHKSCRTVQNWLQSIDFGPLEQHPEIDPISGEVDEGIGACLTPALSTKEFYDLKLFQVDEELPDQINPLFNPINTMYYVDRMGNLLQSIKQSFYEKSEDKSYISKMFSSDNNASTRENLCKSYDVIREIYESILQPTRQRQLCYNNRLYQQDVKDAKLACSRIKDTFSVEDLTNIPHLNIDMHSDKSPTGLTFFDLHAHSILEISFFTMTTHQYMKVLMGLPEYDKNLGDNTQVLLKAKIDILKKRLVKSVNEHEFELVYYIRFLKSQKYNCNVFGKFNPISVNEEEIIEQMAKRR